MELITDLFDSAKTWCQDLFDKAWDKVVDFFTFDEEKAAAITDTAYTFAASVVSAVPIVVAANMTLVWPAAFFGGLTAASPLIIPFLGAVNFVFWLHPALKAGSKSLEGDRVAMTLQAISWLAIPSTIIGTAALLSGIAISSLPIIVPLMGIIPLTIRALWAYTSW